ncbi:MAG: RNA polymerase sigma factor [Saprospiraceae bacterium]
MAKNQDVLQLINGCRKRDRVSQIQLYKHFFSYGMGVCLPYTQTREEALEVVNDGFLKAFTKIDQYNAAQPFKPWLRRVLINCSIDYYRKYHKNNDLKEQELTEQTTKETYNDALDNLAFADLIKVMQKLPPAYRMVFNLYVIENHSHQEIADQLNISIGTSKSNLAKARKKIKELLKQSHGIFYK